MKRAANNRFTRGLLALLALFPLRLVSTALHMTTLDRLYKPRAWGKTSHITLDQELIDSLPAHSTDVIGRAMDPINLLFVGTESGLRRAFEKAGWHGAGPATPLHLLYGGFTSLFKRSYKTGPFTPHFINIGMQDLSFQQTTKGNKFSQRHHIRVWRTRRQLPNEQWVWIAAASYDRSLRIGLLPPFLHHHIDPNLDKERDYIVAELIKVGNLVGDSYPLNAPVKPRKPRKNATGAPYFTDGQAVMVEII